MLKYYENNGINVKSLGVLIDDTTIKQYALNAGIWDGNGTMNQQQKVLARYNAILSQTTSSWASTTKATENGTVVIGDLSKTINKNLMWVNSVVYKNGEPTNVGCTNLFVLTVELSQCVTIPCQV